MNRLIVKKQPWILIPSRKTAFARAPWSRLFWKFRAVDFKNWQIFSIMRNVYKNLGG